jgi:manganese efflux pump family protein
VNELATILVIGLLAGLDNLQVGAALGLVRMPASRRLAFALAFLLCETGMPLLGLTGGRWVHQVSGPWAEGIGSLLLAVCGGWIVAMTLRGGEDDASKLASGGLTLVGLPLTLSFDNLFAGLGLGTLGFPVVLTALGIGILSGGLGAVGLYAGARLRRWVPERAELLSGTYLLALAGFRLWKDLI